MIPHGALRGAEGAFLVADEVRIVQPFFVKDLAMLPLIPTETMAGAVELVCYFFTVIGVAFSYLFTLRG